MLSVKWQPFCLSLNVLRNVCMDICMYEYVYVYECADVAATRIHFHIWYTNYIVPALYSMGNKEYLTVSIYMCV